MFKIISFVLVLSFRLVVGFFSWFALGVRIGMVVWGCWVLWMWDDWFVGVVVNL